MGSMHQRQGNACAAPRFTIGRDHHGWWVVQDRLGQVGGYFANEYVARHFAAEESNHNPADVFLAPEGMIVELDPSARRQPGAPRHGPTIYLQKASDCRINQEWGAHSV